MGIQGERDKVKEREDESLMDSQYFVSYNIYCGHLQVVHDKQSRQS